MRKANLTTNFPSRFIITYFLLIILTGCKLGSHSSQQTVPMNNPTAANLESSQQEVSSLLTDLNKYEIKYLLYDRLSPDGYWVVQNFNKAGEYLRIFAINDSENFYEVQIEATDAISVTLDSWSPSSDAIAVLGADKISKCGWDRVIIYQMLKDHQLQKSIYHLPDGDFGCLGIKWSPDGTQLALFNDAYQNIYILDRQARLVLQKGNSKQIEQRPFYNIQCWADGGLFIGFTDTENNSEIRLYESVFSDDYQVILKNTPANVLGGNSVHRQALIYAGSSIWRAESRSKLIVWDLNLRQASKEIQVQGFLQRADVPSSERWVGLDIRVSKDSRRLYVLDWNTFEITDYGEIAALIGWRANVQGFLVLQGDYDDPSVNVIKVQP